MTNFKTLILFIILITSVIYTQGPKKRLNARSKYNTLKISSTFPIGVAVNKNSLDSKIYKKVLLREFNSITTENSLKWRQTAPSATEFTFADADPIVKFATQNGIRVHGHCLIYFENTPDWLQNFQGDTAAWDTIFKHHIQTLVTHFKGKIAGWDVVNEAFNDAGARRLYTDDKKYVNIWEKHLGKDYIAKAFIYAHMADPSAILFYNDYAQERAPKKLDAILELVNTLKSQNVPIGGLGIQLHIDINTNIDGVNNALKKLSATGLKIHISELDIRQNPSDKTEPASTFGSQKQSEMYYAVANSYKTIVPKKLQYGITFWGLSDKDSWIRNSQNKKDSPLLFDDQYNTKQSFKAFIRGLRQ